MTITAATLTLGEAKSRIKAMGMVVNSQDGELRVSYPKGMFGGTYEHDCERREATCYYTTDREDAVLTAATMVGWAVQQGLMAQPN